MMKQLLETKSPSSAPRFIKAHAGSLLLVLLGIFAARADEGTFRLAKELLAENEYGLSAVEFRRFSMETDDPAEQTASYLFAGYAYLLDKDGTSAGEMLDRAEGVALEAESDHLLLSGETARLKNEPDSALYFYDALAQSADPASQTFARRRAAAIELGRSNFDAAQRQLEQSPSDETKTLAALEAYANGADKSPVLGGLLGLIPGAGYWYSGEIVIGLRSLILNSLFLYGMYQTADDGQWGAFAVISFFEITWYSGSIYGGIDAAQRYNQNRLGTALDHIEGGLSCRPDPEIVVPIFKLNIHFQ